MGSVELSKDRKEFIVYFSSKEDIAVMKTAFRATPATDDLSQLEMLETYNISTESLGNICALWAMDFSWNSEALRALVDSLMPLAQRKNSYRTVSPFDKRDPKPGELIPR